MPIHYNPTPELERSERRIKRVYLLYFNKHGRSRTITKFKQLMPENRPESIKVEPITGDLNDEGLAMNMGLLKFCLNQIEEYLKQNYIVIIPPEFKVPGKKTRVTKKIIKVELEKLETKYGVF